MSKIVPLESLRGIAAVGVVVHHFLLGFYPRLHGMEQYRPGESLLGTPFFGLIHGEAWVYFFFCLSGFVLTFQYLSTGNQETLRFAIMKRWPRLVLLPLLSCLVSWVLLRSGGFYNVQAAKISTSSWLIYSAPLNHEANSSLIDAIWQGLTTFFSNANGFNSNLWTMKLEFYGSMAVFLGIFALRTAAPAARVLGVLLLSCCTFYFHLRLLPFVFGLVFSFWYVGRHLAAPRPMHWGWAAGLLALSIGLFGFKSPVGYYSVFAAVEKVPHIHLVLYSLGAWLLLYVATRSPGVSRVLSIPVLRFLGRISFALYVIHGLVIWSLGSAIYVGLDGLRLGQWPSLALLFLLVLGVSGALSYVLTQLDEAWVRFLNLKATRWFASTPPA